VVVEETADVLLRHPGRATIGTGTVVMVGALVDLVPDDAEPSVGEWCTFAPRSRCLGVRVGNACTVSAGTSVGPAHALFRDGPMPDRTVVYGSASAARTWDGSGEAQEREVRVNATAFLREILPKYVCPRWS
jgi:tetrahydrodipicolinate N-succinyltransferase